MITEDEIFTLFNIFDKNKNHVLEKNEFVTGFAKLCPYFSTKTIHCLFRFCDKDHNGSLDLNEFISLIRFVEKKIYKDDPFIVLFDKCDENGDGKLNFEEFCHVWMSIEPDVGKERLRELFISADGNENQVLEFEEYMQFVAVMKTKLDLK